MYIVGVTGGTGSGKTTFVNALLKSLDPNNISYISCDSYYNQNLGLTFEDRDKLNYDTPSAIDYDLLYNQIKKLKKGSNIFAPNYCFNSHKRLKKTTLIKPKRILVIEGILILNDHRLRNIIDMKIFLECSEMIRTKRRIKRDTEERGRNEEDVLRLFDERLNEMHEKYVEPIKKFCDIIIDSQKKVDLKKLIKVLNEEVNE